MSVSCLGYSSKLGAAALPQFHQGRSTLSTTTTMDLFGFGLGVLNNPIVMGPFLSPKWDEYVDALEARGRANRRKRESGSEYESDDPHEHSGSDASYQDSDEDYVEDRRPVIIVVLDVVETRS